MKLSISKVSKKSPLDCVLDELDGVVGDSISRSFLKRGEEEEVEESPEGVSVIEEMVDAKPEVEGEEEELPEDLKRMLIEALSK